MRIAFVTPYLPVPADTGGKIRSYHLLRGLARHHDVDLYTGYHGNTPPGTDALQDTCGTVFLAPLSKDTSALSRLVGGFGAIPRPVDHFQSPASLSQTRERLRNGRYDLLVADEICMAPYVQGIPGPKLVSRHKVDHLHYGSVAAARPWGPEKVAAWADAWQLHAYEQRAMTGFHAAVCCSDDDAASVRSLNPEVPITVIGNGVDLDYFEPSAEVGHEPTLLYLGTMHYYPNIDAVHHFFRRIYPHLVKLVPNVRVQVVGQGPPPEVLAWESVPGVSITGSVPDVRPYLSSSTAVMVPLRLGGGTRLKILEAIAAGRPVVSTTVGAEGLGLRHDEHILLSDDPAGFARKAADLLGDAVLRRRLVAAARPFVESTLSWSALGGQFEALCRDVAGRDSH